MLQQSDSVRRNLAKIKDQDGRETRRKHLTYPLYLQKQTCGVQLLMSALGHFATDAAGPRPTYGALHGRGDERVLDPPHCASRLFFTVP
jgi:hypothetical protein